MATGDGSTRVDEGEAADRPPPPPNAGLCAACLHRRVITSRRGSRFLMCELSKTDPAFPRYPPLPVLACGGFTPEEA